MIDLLVLGGNSQDGLTLLELTKKSNIKAVFVARKKSSEINNNNEMTLVEDYKADKIRDMVNKVNPRYVLNLIGQSSVGRSFQIPEETFNVNYMLAKQILNIVVNESSATFIQASSAYIFDCSNEIGPGARLNAISPYAKSKSLLYEEFREGKLKGCEGRLFSCTFSIISLDFQIKDLSCQRY